MSQCDNGLAHAATFDHATTPQVWCVRAIPHRANEPVRGKQHQVWFPPARSQSSHYHGILAGQMADRKANHGLLYQPVTRGVDGMTRALPRG